MNEEKSAKKVKQKKEVNGRCGFVAKQKQRQLTSFNIFICFI